MKGGEGDRGEKGLRKGVTEPGRKQGRHHRELYCQQLDWNQLRLYQLEALDLHHSAPMKPGSQSAVAGLGDASSLGE